MIFTPMQIRKWDCDTEVNGWWIPARPVHYLDRWRNRVKWAWGVLTGRYDALDWRQ